MKSYKNIILVDNLDNADFVTHSGKFHVDDVMSTVFLSKIYEKINLIRVPYINGLNIQNKFLYDIGYRRI